MQSDFVWLQKWYATQFKEKQDLDDRIYLVTLDNPGWELSVNLQNTNLQNKKLQEIATERSEDDWVFCNIKNNRFEGFCGPENLPELLKLFRNWVEE